MQLGTLAGSPRLRVLMSGVFGSVDAMLNGKKYSRNVRALRIGLLAEVLLRPIFQPDCKDVLPPSSMGQLFELDWEYNAKKNKSGGTECNKLSPISTLFLGPSWSFSAHMTFDILISLKTITYFVKTSKYDLADYTKTTKSRIKFQLKVVKPS